MANVAEIDLKVDIDRSYRNATVVKRESICYEINQKISQRLSKDSFAGKRVFIIAGGESLKGFDFGRLNNELTIGVNKVFQYYRDATINYAMDQDLYDKITDGRLSGFSGVDVKQKWDEFRGIRIFLCPLTTKKFGKEVYLVKRSMSSVVSLDVREGIHPGRNSATGALMLAIALGARNIYLLGYDMHAKVSSHWHDGYPDRNLDDFNKKLGDYRRELDALAPAISEVGVKVTNLNPDSSLRCFPFSTSDEVLKNADLQERFGKEC